MSLLNYLLKQYSRHGLEIVAICDNHAEHLEDARRRLQAVATECGVAASIKTYGRMEDLIADPSIDLVMITTPQDAHEKPFVLAAEAGKLIYCDKPLAHSPQSCQNMYDVWRDRRPRCLIGFTRRYEPLWQRARQMVADGAVGQPHMILLRCVIWHPTYFSTWFRNSEISGGLLNEKCAHHFDVFNWFTESRPTLVHAVGGRRVFTPRQGYPQRCAECDRECEYRSHASRSHGNYADDPRKILAKDLCVYSPEANIVDHASVNLKFANGMIGSLFFTIFGPNADSQETLEVVGDSGKLILSRRSTRIELFSDFGRAHHVTQLNDPEVQSGHHGADAALVRTLSKFARDGVEPPATLEDAYYASMTSFLAQQSVDTGDSQRPEWAESMSRAAARAAART